MCGDADHGTEQHDREDERRRTEGAASAFRSSWLGLAHAHARQQLVGATTTRFRASMRLGHARQAIVGQGRALTVARTAPRGEVRP